MDNQTISARQYMFLVIFFIIGSSILIVPTPLAAQGKQDAWMSVILSILVGVILVMFLNKIGSLSSGKTFVQAAIFVFGNWAGRLFCIFYLSFLYILASLVLRNIGDFMTTQIIPETPLQFTHTLFLLVIIAGTYLGIESIARSSEIFMPWMIILLIFLTISMMPQINMGQLKPMFGNGVLPIISSSSIVIGTPLLEMVALLMIFPYVKEEKKAKRAWILGTIIGGGVLFLITTLCLLVLGSDLTALNAYPTYRIGQKINIAGFLEGLEIIIAIIWMLTIFFKLIILYYATSVGIAQFLTLKDHRPLVLPLGMGMVVLSIIAYPDVAYFETFVGEVWLSYSLTHGLILPAILWVGLLIKKRMSGS
ncbi:spore gernimation protein [Halobacillus halophilus]|uniref:Spore germination protein n=1 Tax=Halobacillus halophilus (strain ATCC 35676 / DSM 2266 / JCM 20832 / KCTC 3685 / LMG 17431 / NBRC 102448 / NCIMB 2269) TaxID=866895 RepID=I0JSW4_HALH3|nr:endospore germination permease [Halobacillus halophilus]ASF41157.1 spore gernimation protein [Halobacillus halophilus]CCG47236.1 spore germination protein [Halobacillus halophilus DSM 2266]